MGKSELLEVAEARDVVLEFSKPLDPVRAGLSPELLGRVLAMDIVADRDWPPFAKSLRDGYAVRSSDCTAAAELRVVEEIAAGVMPKKAIGPGECARIFTGAPMPEGSDAVVMQEDTEAAGERVRITDSNVRPGQWVFPRASEMRAGEVVLSAGTRLGAAAHGLLASVGASQVAVYPRPIVSVIATGDELVAAQLEPGPGQIRNSNGPMLAALLQSGGSACRDCGIARDTEGDLKAAIEPALAESNVVLLAGGVSAGKFDLVPGILEQLGVKTHFHKVRMKPGKPLLFGTKGDTLVFGLPGNPVSAFVCFELFVRPALAKLSGERKPGPQVVELPLAEAIAESNDRPAYRPAKREGPSVRSLPWAGAPDLRGIVEADALIALPAGESRLDPGDVVKVISLPG